MNTTCNPDLENSLQICVIVPHFDHLDQFRKILPGLLTLGFPLVVVDDASAPPVFDALEQLLRGRTPGCTLIRHPQNRGKGDAVMTGFEAALEAGYTHALQIDADGQHDLPGAKNLVAEARRFPDCFICGQPVFDDSISGLRFYARYITLYLVWLETLSNEIRDALCGFRLYPLKQMVALVRRNRPGRRMAFDPEILVRAIWSGESLRFIPVNIAYPEDGKSHFHYLRDNLFIAWMHVRLVFGMFLRIPGLVKRNRARNVERAL